MLLDHHALTTLLNYATALVALAAIGLFGALVRRTTVVSLGTERALTEVAVFRHRYLPARFLDLWYDARVLVRAYEEARQAAANFPRRRAVSHIHRLVLAITALPRTLKEAHRDALGRLVSAGGRYGRVRPSGASYGPGYEPEPLRYAVSGHSKLPRRVYEGDSVHVYLDLRVSLAPHTSTSDSSAIPDIAIDSDTFSLTLHSPSMLASIAVELSANGFAVLQVSDKARVLTSGEHRFSWLCEFPKSGVHAYVFKVSVGADYDGILASSRYEVPMSVSVVKVDHLTSRQVWVLASASATVAAAMALIRLLHDLGVMAF